MKKLLLLLAALFVLFVVVDREKLFLRDPLAHVTVNDVVQDNTRVYINYSNDVLIEHTMAPVTLAIVQHNQHAGTPKELRCIRWLACLTDAAPATLVETMKGSVGEMSGKLVTFQDDRGQTVKVTLR